MYFQRVLCRNFAVFRSLYKIHINSVRALTKERITTWLDAQHQYAAIARRAPQPTALHAVDVMEEAMGGTVATGRTHLRLTPRREALGAAGVAAGQAVAQSRAGLEPVRPCGTRLKKCEHSHQSATASRIWRSSLTFGMYSYATHGTTGRGQPRSFTICWSRVVCVSGSARKTLASASRCFVQSTRAWQTRK